MDATAGNRGRHSPTLHSSCLHSSFSRAGAASSGVAGGSPVAQELGIAGRAKITPVAKGLRRCFCATGAAICSCWKRSMRVLRSVLCVARHPATMRWRKILKPRVWATVFGLQRKYPEAWKWIVAARSIEGWLSDGEANELFRLARQFAPRQGAIIVELGSWKGKSSVMLAAGLLGKETPRLFCIDPFGRDENPEHQERYYADLLRRDPRDVKQVFRDNIAAFGLQDIVHPLKGYSFEFVTGWQERIDLLFIDANHEYEAVLRDFRQWSAFVKPGGVIVFHDANGRWPGPTRVVSE